MEKYLKLKIDKKFVLTHSAHGPTQAQMGLGQNGPGPNGLGRNGLWVKLGRPVWVWVELTQNPVGLGRNGSTTSWVGSAQTQPMVSLNTYIHLALNIESYL